MSASPAPAAAFQRLLLTGAAGALGRELRPRLKARCAVLRVSDIADLGVAADGEEAMPAALENADAMLALLAEVDAVVHLGGVSVEGPFAPILQANIVGAYNLYEAARRQGVRRIVLASSNHVTGFYRQDEVIDARMPMRPDGHYGLSKAFGENLAQFYFDRYGIETVSLRIGSSFPEPVDRRMLATWMSYDDLERLVVASLTAPVVGHSVIHGVSDNATIWWDNTPASHIGYRPRDSSEPFRAAAEARQPVLDHNDPAVIRQGGGFVTRGSTTREGSRPMTGPMTAPPSAGRSIVCVSDSGTGEIVVLALDAHGVLDLRQRVALGGMIMPLTPSPDRTRLYVARRSPPLVVISLAIGADGGLTPLAEADLPASMAFLATDGSGRWLFSASYGGDLIAVSRIDADGIARALTQIVPTEPHAHAIHADPSNRFVVATCLGGDLLRRFDFAGDAAAGKDATLTDHAEARLPIEPRGARRPGPHHLAFHPNGTWLYVLNELDASVAVFGFDAVSGALELRQRVDTAPAGLDGEPWAAEIRIAADGRHLYTSERRSSTLAAFRIDPASGALTLLGHQPTEAQPRSFALDPGGRWLGASLAIGSTPSEIEIITLPRTPEP